MHIYILLLSTSIKILIDIFYNLYIMVFTCNKALVVAFLFVAKEDEDDFFEEASESKKSIREKMQNFC